MQSITLLGATGSIGLSTLDVVARHPDRYRVHALTAHSKVDELAAQCVRFQPQVAVVGSADGAARLSQLLREQGVRTEVATSGEEVGALTFADLLFEIAEVEAWA